MPASVVALHGVARECPPAARTYGIPFPITALIGGIAVRAAVVTTRREHPPRAAHPQDPVRQNGDAWDGGAEESGSALYPRADVR
ncbi:hypothetical protein ACLMNJ_27730 [Streptomyces seoulensis]